MTHSKECFKCKTIKPLDEFYKHSQMADGYLNKCKECNKKDSINNRNAKIDHYRAYDAVTRAIRSGKLIRQPCIRCGNEKSLAHHEDYDFPLDVMWLCQPCHKQRHKELLLMP